MGHGERKEEGEYREINNGEKNREKKKGRTVKNKNVESREVSFPVDSTTQRLIRYLSFSQKLAIKTLFKFERILICFLMKRLRRE